MKVFYAAAHADFPDTEPLGGGKAVADYLVREWRTSCPFEFETISPDSLGLRLGQPLVEMGEFAYARFCREFERAATARLLSADPRATVVLTNDLSEGPDFAALGRAGFRIVSLWHVDVVDFFTRMYLRGWIRTETAARAWRLPLPGLLRLVFHKQHDCVRHSARIVVPSEPMRETIRRSYRECPEERVEVLPWGDLSASETPAASDVPDVAADEYLVVTMSRISSEKGLERLLRALPRVETEGRRVCVMICGAPAFMTGQRCLRRLRRLVRRVPACIRVDFPGHLTAGRKAAMLRRADLFVSPSVHESYGLAIAEARSAGCRILSNDHYGASGWVVDCADPHTLAAAISDEVRAGRRPPRPTTPTARGADPWTARRLADLIRRVAAAPNFC
ncbi:MAG: glycosyltransferase family 4 protein [Verrucomicrobiae bacterium]|nr:glycosyltransferase family 4 protein [Verrucomicrobiae bacterium]